MYGLALAGERKAVAEARRTLFLPGLRPENLAYVVLIDAMLGHERQSGAKTAGQQSHCPRRYAPLAGSRQGLYSADQDDMTATAMALRVIVRHDPQDPRIAPILRWLMYRRTGEYWGSTRDTAWVLAALGDYLNASRDFPPAGRWRYSQRQRVADTGPDRKQSARKRDRSARTARAAPRRQERDTADSRRRQQPDLLFHAGAADHRRGRHRGPRQRYQTTANSKAKGGEAIGIDRQYLRVAAKRAGDNPWDLRTEPTHNQMAAGDRIRVRLTLNVPRDMAYVLIEDPFPAGCEVSERGDSGDVPTGTTGGQAWMCATTGSPSLRDPCRKASTSSSTTCGRRHRACTTPCPPSCKPCTRRKPERQSAQRQR